MYAIIGLGNPTAKYEKTRHNIGFDVIDVLADKMSIEMKTKKHKAIIGQSFIGSEKVILVKPQTYMNLSGEAVRAVVDFYKINPESDIIVIYDDVSLKTGQLRIRGKGSAGGHNGIKSIIAHLGTQTFKRIKVGVGADGNGDLVNHVLGKFNRDDRVVIDEAIENAASAAAVIVLEGIDAAMNKYNMVQESKV